MVGKPRITPQMNVGVPPPSVQMQGGTTRPSPQPLGQVPPLSQFQQMGGSNVPLNPSTSYGQGNPQHQQAPQLGPFIPNLLYQQPIIGVGHVPLTATPPKGSNPQSGWNQPGGIYAPGGARNFGNVPFTGGFNPSQQGGYAAPWPPVTVKIPTDIPKFDGKTGEDPANHITTYHLWCVSNSFLDDSIKLRLFPWTLTGNATKWFIKLPSAAFFDFQSLAIAFLTHFQLPICYETGTELLTSLRQNTATHISDHIHEWRR